MRLGQWWLVALGGAAGSVARYVTATVVQAAAGPLAFPWGTAVVNVIGCFLIGLLQGLAEFRGLIGPSARLLLMTGVLGGFTTFSTFGLETIQLVRDARFAAAGANVLFQAAVGLVAVMLGFGTARVL